MLLGDGLCAGGARFLPPYSNLDNVYVQTESEIQKQTESVILDQARVTKREAHTTGLRTRLLRVGGSWLERADPGNLHRRWPKPPKEQTYLREVGVLVLVAQPSDSSAGSPEKCRFV